MLNVLYNAYLTCNTYNISYIIQYTVYKSTEKMYCIQYYKHIVNSKQCSDS